jgi:hypothetical protein
MSNSDQTKPGRRKLPAGQVILIGAAFLVGFIILGALAALVWDYSNSVAFCTDACHDVHPEEPAAFQDSYHGSVKCTECHMGRLGTLESIALKATHAKHLPEMLFNHWDRPLESATMRPANESCEMCHYPPAFHGDRVMEIKRFASDKDNTGRRIYLILKTGGGQRSTGQGYGIHWHISNKVEFIATDEQKQDIRWIRSTLPDGRTVEYNDVTDPLTPEQIASLPKHTMDCVDCHNRVGHPFTSPWDAADKALANGQLSAGLPYLKEQMMSLLNASYADQATAVAAVAGLTDAYKKQYPDVAASQAAAIEQAQKWAEDEITRLVFAEPGVTWRSFPDSGKHKYFPGCFRCHDGKHLASDGESVRLHCNICHSIPATVEYKAHAPLLPVATQTEPESHLQTNFMADHRFLANDSCAQCHGPVTFGSDDSNFCANSTCHGQAWPAVALNAAFPHPIKLEGKHAQTWCFSCHQGVKKPVYDCARCHKPPATHFSGKCETCHNPTGFKESAAQSGNMPAAIPHTLEGRDNCLACHDPAGKVKPAPANHKGFDSKSCVACHEPRSAAAATPKTTPASATPAAPSASVPAVTHPLEGRENCVTCHDPDGKVKPAPASHKGYDDKQCTTCHAAVTPERKSGEGAAGGPPKISHPLEGRENCVTCHDPGGKVKPAPANHKGYDVKQCSGCHKS